MSDNSLIIEDNEIDLVELCRAIWSGKITIVIITTIFALCSIFYALSKPNIYTSSILLAPSSTQGGAGGLAGLAGKFGGLANIAGLNIGNGNEVDKTSLALATIKARFFIEKFIEKHKLLAPLMASKGWDRESDSLLIDPNLYNKQTGEWIRKVSFPQSPEPSLWEAYQEFLKLLTISQDKVTSLITIELEFFSPHLSKKWLTLLVEDINEFIREQDRIEATASIQFLKDELEHIKVTNMETVFYQLIEEQTKNMMLAQVNKEYVFKTIDPAQIPEMKSGPKRVVYVLLGTTLGAILSIFIVIVRYFFNNKK